MNSLLFTKDLFKKQPADFRIGAIISDGMWYSLPKWRKLAKVTEEEINAWVEEKIKTGELVQSPTGAKSYRFPLESVKKWYSDNNIPLGHQLVDFLFPPRIWDNKTEVEGFLEAPLREVGVVSFDSTDRIAEIITEKLRGIAKVREVEPGKFKAYCLQASYVKPIVEEVFKNAKEGEVGKIYSRSVAKRREIIDFTPEYAKGLLTFYRNFGKSLVKRGIETIKIFLPEPEDQDSQIIIWVITAIEKFDEKASVPFSGYLDNVLGRWPHDLPVSHLGKDLSLFQRQRSRAIKSLTKRLGDDRLFTADEISKEMEISRESFNDLEEKHNIWTKIRTSTTLTWDENNDEKLVVDEAISSGVSNSRDIELSNKLSYAIINAAIHSEQWDDAFLVIEHMDINEVDFTSMKKLSPEFVKKLAEYLSKDGVL